MERFFNTLCLKLQKDEPAFREWYQGSKIVMKEWDRQWKSEKVLDKLCKCWAQKHAFTVDSEALVDALTKSKKFRQKRERKGLR